ncbi:MAG: ABC transporter ATP-binding protein, partial [Planctomycetota bacterium]
MAAFFSVTNKVLDLAPPLLIGLAVDVVTLQEKSFLGRNGYEDPSTQVWIVAGLTLLIWGLESLTEYLLGIQWRNLAQSIQHDLRLEAYDKVQNLELAFFEDRDTGELMSVLNDDVNQLERFLDDGANSIIQVVTTVLVIGAIFFYLEPQVAWMAMVPMPFVIMGSVAYQKLLAPRYSAVREEVGALNSDLSGNLGGIATIKGYTAEARELNRIRDRSNAYRERNKGAIRLSSAFAPLIRMVIVCGFAAALVKGGFLVLEEALAVSAYTTLVFMTQRLLWPLTR